MSRKQFAKLVGYSESWIRQVETNRHNPPSPALDAISNALALSPLERRYLLLLGGNLGEVPAFTAPQIDRYLESLHPHPAAYLNRAWTVKQSNSEFERIFKGIWIHRNLLSWHYVGVQSRNIMLDWQSSSDWIVANLRYNLAAVPNYPALGNVVEQLMPIQDFERQWMANVIPTDPLTRPWSVKDLDNDAVLSLDMRVWQSNEHPARLLLLGVKQ